MAATTDHFRRGETIFRKGEAADVAYIIESGAIEISLPSGDEKKVLAILGPGEVFGEMGPVDGLPRSADATAVLDTTLLKVDKEQIGRRLECSDPFIVGLFRTISGRLRTRYGERLTTDCEQKERQENLISEIKVERLIREGLEAGEFQPFFQPIMDMRKRRIVGFECLVRWCQMDGKVMPPGRFIPLAERSGLIRDIDIYMLRRSAELFKEYDGPDKGLYLSVNLSTSHFGNDEVVDQVDEALSQAGLGADAIRFEVTESALIKHPEAARNVLDQFKERGFLISLDDFGTGYSSLNYLHKYPIDVLKIDRSFVDTMMHNAKGERIVDAMIALAGSLSLQVVAEGVEREEQAEQLLHKGVHLAQGWLFGKPVPVADAFAMTDDPAKAAAS